MENASKALLIAAGILIAIIIIAIFINMYGKISSIQETQDEKTKMEQLAEFNAEYESYNKTLMYGTDVVTLVNKANENNRKRPNSTIHVYLTIDTIDRKIVKEIQLVKENVNNIILNYGIITFNDNSQYEEDDIIAKR